MNTYNEQKFVVNGKNKVLEICCTSITFNV